MRRMLRALMWTALVVLAGCEPRPAPFSGIDCGLTVESVNAAYDVAGRECVWNAYSSRTPVRWQVTSLTTEGDPIRQTLKFDPVLGVVIDKDMSADRFSGQANRRVWIWRCPTMAKVTWSTDASRYSFSLTSCTGDGPTTSFP
jgi:hypothetical protein